MNKNKISIIIPVYNEYEEYLIQCVESAINQTYNNIEIIIINDGSIKNVKELCDELTQRDNRIKVIHKENEGVSKARNIGILESTGDYIMFIDSDDWLEREACEKIIKQLDENTDMIISNSYLNYSTKKIKNYFCPDTYNVLTIEQMDDLQIQNISKTFSTHTPCEAVVGVVWGKLIKKDYIIKNNIFFKEDLKQGEDLIFFMQIFEKQGIFKYYNEHLYNHRKSKKSAVNKFSPEIEVELEKLLKYMYIIVREKTENFMQAYYVKIVNSIFFTLKNDYFHPNNKEKKKEKLKRLKNMLNREIYNLGIKNADEKKLNKKSRTQYFILKQKKYIMLYIWYMIKNYRTRRKMYE